MADLTLRLVLFEQTFAKLYRSAEYADLFMKCGPYHFAFAQGSSDGTVRLLPSGLQARPFHRHTNIVDLPAHGSGAQDGSGVIDRDYSKGDDPEVFKIMIYWLYHQRYVNPVERKTSVNPKLKKPSKAPGATNDFDMVFENGDTELVMHAILYAMAVKYQVRALETFAWKHFINLLWRALRSDLPKVMIASIVAPAVYVVYCSTPSCFCELRDAVLIAFGDLQGLKLLSEQPIKDAINKLPEFAANLIESATRREINLFEESPDESDEED